MAIFIPLCNFVFTMATICAYLAEENVQPHGQMEPKDSQNDVDCSGKVSSTYRRCSYWFMAHETYTLIVRYVYIYSH